MAAERLTDLPRATDANGNPLSGALFYFYATGTTTPQSVYTTSALSVAHANPVVADSGGSFAPIYFDSSLSYRGVLKTAGGVTLRDIDPINTATATASAISYAEWASLAAKLDAFPHFFDEIPAAKHNGILAGTNTDELDGYIQTLLDLAVPVVMPKSGRVWFGESVFVPSYGGLIGNFGCEIKAVADFGDYPLIRNQTNDPASLAARDKGIILKGVRVNGNKASNSTATEYSHGILLNAVDGARLDVWAADCKGDGALINYAYPLSGGSGTNLDIGCRDIVGAIRSEGAARQGVAVTCMEDFDLSIFAYQADLIGLDVEVDNEDNYVRNGQFRVRAVECGQAGSGTRGGVMIFGTNALGTGTADVRNITVDAEVLNCEGTGGIMWRDALDITLRGSVKGQTGYGVYGLGANFAPSRVTVDVNVASCTTRGFLSQGTGDIINGRVNVQTSGDIGCSIDNAAGGTMTVRLRGVTGQGIYLTNTNDMTFHADIHACTGTGVYISGASSGNRFYNLRSTSSSFGWGVQEVDTANNNCVTNARLTGNGGGVATLVGATSAVHLEHYHGAAAGLTAASAAIRGSRALVTDANATTFLTTVAGGGANIVPAICNGTNWVIG